MEEHAPRRQIARQQGIRNLRDCRLRLERQKNDATRCEPEPQSAPRLLFAISHLVLSSSQSPPLISRTYEAVHAKHSLEQSLKMIVHTGLDLVDLGLDSHAGAERVHKFQIFAAEGEMVIFELRRPVRPEHVFKAAAGNPSGPGRVGL